MLPHRDPMLLVDRVCAVDLHGETLWAERRLDPADPVFAGHFPGQPVYPGALLLEAIGQAALCLHHLLEHGRATVRPDDRPRPVRLMRVHEATFLRECLPGDRLELVARRLASDGLCMTTAAQAIRAGAVAAAAVLEVFLVEDAP
jgi:3-hydroxymyristoyl/3-hydroxydecanoyl-(acyl carrier protein) dehydratase